MTETARPFARRRRRESQQEEARRTLAECLTQTRGLIAQAYQGFNAVQDPDLIESYVYEINALRAQYDYALQNLKRMY